MAKLSVSWLLLLLFFCLLAAAQTRSGSGFPKPPEPADRSSSATNEPTTRRIRIDAIQLQRDAKELSDLAQSLPADIDQINRGLLPKDILVKLKRIEKLSKRLRGELAPW